MSKIKIFFLKYFHEKTSVVEMKFGTYLTVNSINQVSDRRGVSIIQYPWNEELASSPDPCRWGMARTAVPAHTAVSATFFVKSYQIGHATGGFRLSTNQITPLTVSEMLLLGDIA